MKRPITQNPSFIVLLLATCFALTSALASAEQVRIPIGQETRTWSGETPRRGLTMAQVEERYGAPLSKQGPSGQPPIYFWEYSDFTVYFESNFVIHAVVKTRK